MKNRPEILVVDDEESIAMVLSELFRDDGYSVTKALSGAEARLQLHKRQFQLIMLDLVLPDAHGIELLREVRAAFPKTDVIVITSHASLETAVEALRLGAYDYLFKPFDDLDVVSHLVKNAIEKQQAAEENERLHRELTAKATELESHVKRLAVLNDSGRALHSMLNINDLLKFTIQLMAKELKAKRISLMIKDITSEELMIKASVGLDEQLAQTVRVPVGMGIAGWVAQTGTALLIEDIEKDPRFKDGRDYKGYDTNSFISAPLVLSVPIQYQNKVIGVININNKEDGGVFSKSDLAFVSTLTSQAAIAIENARIFENLKDTRMEVIAALAKALEEKDATSGKHSARLMQYAQRTAHHLGLDEEAQERARYAAVLHDIGKIGVREQVLQKPGKLTQNEYEEIKNHPHLGAALVSNVTFLSSVAPIIMAHHEWYDGNGYPQGFSGDAIPVEARIVAVMDSYDAMISDRPYRAALGKEYAVKQLKAFAGSQFDPMVVEAFLSVLEKDEKGGEVTSDEHISVDVSIPAGGKKNAQTR
jgi:putative nucleotidyltransferase with HDIG domain